MSWAEIKKAVNTRPDEPLNYLMWINDVAGYGEDSYVMEDIGMIEELVMKSKSLTKDVARDIVEGVFERYPTRTDLIIKLLERNPTINSLSQWVRYRAIYDSDVELLKYGLAKVFSTDEAIGILQDVKYENVFNTNSSVQETLASSVFFVNALLRNYAMRNKYGEKILFNHASIAEATAVSNPSYFSITEATVTNIYNSTGFCNGPYSSNTIGNTPSSWFRIIDGSFENTTVSTLTIGSMDYSYPDNKTLFEVSGSAGGNNPTFAINKQGLGRFMAKTSPTTGRATIHYKYITSKKE